jgi:hypothetical protein
MGAGGLPRLDTGHRMTIWEQAASRGWNTGQRVAISELRASGLTRARGSELAAHVAPWLRAARSPRAAHQRA